MDARMDTHFATLMKHGSTNRRTACLPASLPANQMHVWTKDICEPPPQHPNVWAYMVQRRAPGYDTIKRKDCPNLP